MVVASPIHVELNSEATLSDGTKLEAIAAVDSKGIVHAPPAQLRRRLLGL